MISPENKQPIIEAIDHVLTKSDEFIDRLFYTCNEVFFYLSEKSAEAQSNGVAPSYLLEYESHLESGEWSREFIKTVLVPRGGLTFVQLDRLLKEEAFLTNYVDMLNMRQDAEQAPETDEKLHGLRIEWLEFIKGKLQ